MFFTLSSQRLGDEVAYFVLRYERLQDINAAWFRGKEFDNTCAFTYITSTQLMSPSTSRSDATHHLTIGRVKKR